MTRWEYRTTDISIMEGRPLWGTLDINKPGLEGWELVSCVPIIKGNTTTALALIFKRPAPLDEDAGEGQML